MKTELVMVKMCAVYSIYYIRWKWYAFDKETDILHIATSSKCLSVLSSMFKLIFISNLIFIIYIHFILLYIKFRYTHSFGMHKERNKIAAREKKQRRKEEKVALKTAAKMYKMEIDYTKGSFFFAFFIASSLYFLSCTSIRSFIPLHITSISICHSIFPCGSYFIHIFFHRHRESSFSTVHARILFFGGR